MNRRLRAAALLALAPALTLAAQGAKPKPAPKPAPPAPAAPAAPAPALRPATQREELERIIQRQVLPNGLEVIVVENHGVPLATVELVVRNGSFTQTPDFSGLAHMYEHMFFKSNEDYPHPEQFVARASQLGAIYNASTREEVVNYYLTVPSDSLEGAMEFLESAFRAPLFRSDELDTEKQVVIGEYDRQESSPFFHLLHAMDQAMWGSEVERKNMIGDRKVIEHVTTEQMFEIQHRYYLPNNAALIVAGDVVPDDAFALAAKIFGPMPRGDDPFEKYPIPPFPPLTKSIPVIVTQPVNAVAVLVQWRGPSVRQDPEATYAADVFSDVLNQDGSNFQKRLVDSGLWTQVLVNYYTLNQTGPITISGETTPDKLKAALAALYEEIAKFDQPGYFTEAELEPQKQQRAVGTAMGLERASGFSHELGFWWSVAGLDYYMGYVDNMAKRTTADLRAYAHKYIVGKPHVAGLLTNPQWLRASGVTGPDLIGERSASPGSTR
ncbi:MAG TPA: pitrilysin family protein [Gemmatimonadaceae bacterium]|nr:pitrilysin family protein [Gemmatimonadaceae bacterium]